MHSVMAVSGVAPVVFFGAEASKMILTGANKASLNLTEINRSPSSGVGGFLRHLDVCLSTREMKQQNNVITGDLNITTLSHESADDLDIIHQYSFINLITSPYSFHRLISNIHRPYPYQLPISKQNQHYNQKHL